MLKNKYYILQMLSRSYVFFAGIIFELILANQNILNKFDIL